MKKCPSCQKTYDDNMKFCQSDGTPLVVVAEEPSDDPYKTMVASDIKLPVKEPAAAEPPEPEPPSAPPPVEVDPAVAAVPEVVEEDDGDVLEIPESKESEDLLKTIIVSGSNTSDNIRVPDLPEKEPPTPANPAPKAEPPGSEAATMITPEIPKFSDPDVKPPDLGAMESRPEDSKKREPVSHEAADSEPSVPIPSPFDESMPPGMAPPDMPPFDKSNSTPDLKPLNEAPETSTPQAVEASSDPEPAAPPASPFADPGAPVNVPEPESWDAPAAEVPAVQSAPASDPFGNNSILNPPAAATGEEGENKTLAIISLVSGILSCLCCFGIITGPAALVLGYMQKGKISEDPGTYGGGMLATIGMILGVIGTILFFALVALQLLGVFAQNF